MTKAPDARSNNIDALRLILALTVLFSHSFPLGAGTQQGEPLAWLSGGQSTLGGLAVAWFFVLSGYLISQSWERSRTAWSFFKKRILRIYPGYIAAAVVSVWVIVPLANPSGLQVFQWRTVLDIIRPVLFLKEYSAPGSFPTTPVPRALNGSLWSISYKFKCYRIYAIHWSCTILGPVPKGIGLQSSPRSCAGPRVAPAVRF